MIEVSGRPQGAVLSLDGTLLYLTNSDGNRISIIDTDTKEVIGEIETAEGPGRIAITPDGKQLVYNLQAGEACGFADIATGTQTDVVKLEGPPLSLNLSSIQDPRCSNRHLALLRSRALRRHARQRMG